MIWCNTSSKMKRYHVGQGFSTVSNYNVIVWIFKLKSAIVMCQGHVEIRYKNSPSTIEHIFCCHVGSQWGITFFVATLLFRLGVRSVGIIWISTLVTPMDDKWKTWKMNPNTVAPFIPIRAAHPAHTLKKFSNVCTHLLPWVMQVLSLSPWRPSACRHENNI